MRRFILITNAYKDKDLSLSKKIIQYICQKGGTARYLISNEDEKNNGYDISDISPDTECILVLGGDGTLIRAATKVLSLHIPLIGINMGTLGYLCELEESTVFEALDNLFEDSYMAEKRIMLTGHKVGEEQKRVALNDIVIHSNKNLQMLSLNVYVNGEFLSTYHSDGIIIATPTGSTGYNMSAGGPIVDPKGNMILLTPINAHNLNSKSIVLGPDDVVEIEMKSRRRQKDECACVSYDGDPYTQMSVGDRVVISKSTDFTTVCKINKRSFLEILSKKMETYT